MDTSAPFSIKKTFLYSLIGSVVLSALLGIFAILWGQFGWLGVRVLLTTVTVAVASICGLACGAYLETNRGRTLPQVGIGLTLLAATMITLGMWIDVDSEAYWKVAASIAVFSVACAHLSLLSMARLAERFQWSVIATNVVVFGVASLIVVMIVFEIEETGMFRLLGVAAIIDAAMTIVVPIFHRLSRLDLEQDNGNISGLDSDAIDAEIVELKQRIAELEGLKQSGCRS